MIIKTHINGIKTIGHFEEAISLALDEQTWTDIREEEMSLVRKELYNIPNYRDFKNQLNDIDERLNSYLEDNVLDEFSDAFNEIFSDFLNIAINRAVNGNKNNFHEKLFEIYKAGGWPCGWEGSYPKGKIVAYFNNK